MKIIQPPILLEDFPHMFPIYMPICQFAEDFPASFDPQRLAPEKSSSNPRASTESSAEALESMVPCSPRFGCVLWVFSDLTRLGRSDDLSG